MTTDAIYEKRGSDWSWQVSVVATTRWLQRDQILSLCEGCGLRDYHLLCLATLGYSNLMFCFTSRISSKSDSVGWVIFVNVNYEYHYRSNFYTYKPETTNNKCKNQHFSPLVGTALSHFTSALTHNRSTISGATHRWTLPTQKKRANSTRPAWILLTSMCACAPY